MGRMRPGAAIWILIAVMIAAELCLALSDLTQIPVRDLRGIAYEYGAFWPGLLSNWLPAFPGQRWTMFVSYGFLHGGIGHLAMNMAVLLALGTPLLKRWGTRRFLGLYLLAQIGGGIGYAALALYPQPMVGASGALFGLLGASMAGDYLRRTDRGMTIGPLVLIWLLLVVLSAAMGERFAWQAHLGGFLAGWFYTLARPHPERRRRA